MKKIILIVKRFITFFLALAIIVIGGHSLLGGFAGYATIAKIASTPDLANEAFALLDNQFRSMAVANLAVGFSFLYCLFRPKQTHNLFVFLISIVLGIGVIRFFTMLQVGFHPDLILLTSIELIFAGILFLIHFGIREK